MRLELQIRDLEQAFTDLQWSTSLHPRHPVDIDGEYQVEEETGCYRPVSPTVEALRRVMCGAGPGALPDEQPLRAWVEFTVRTAGGVADWDAALEHLERPRAERGRAGRPGSPSDRVVDGDERAVADVTDERVGRLRPGVG